jgi:hypothetical protein
MDARAPQDRLRQHPLRRAGSPRWTFGLDVARSGARTQALRRYEAPRRSHHSETRSAFNSGVRASETAVREIARKRGMTYEGDRPTSTGDRFAHTSYVRRWVGRDGHVIIASIVKQQPEHDSRARTRSSRGSLWTVDYRAVSPDGGGLRRIAVVRAMTAAEAVNKLRALEKAVRLTKVGVEAGHKVPGYPMSRVVW